VTAAELVFTGGTVITMDPKVGDVEALAVSGERIAATGSDAHDLIGPGTEVIDLAGRAVLPGFQDAHVHAVWAGLELGTCDLSSASSLDEYRAKITAYVRENPDESWITGGGWAMEKFPERWPTRRQLDALVPDRPVILANTSHHGAWVNTRALQLAGITSATPDPADGRIEREPDGTPSGMLHEGAVDLVRRLVPPPDEDTVLRGLLRAQSVLHSVGITAWQDAIVGGFSGHPDVSAAYLVAAESGLLTARVRGALWWDRSSGAEQIPSLVERRARLGAGRFKADTVKIMQDGTVEHLTAAVSVPYRDDCGCATDNTGISFVDPEALKLYVTELDALGFQVHFHALGDRGARESLDAVETARDRNGDQGNRHHIAHLEVVNPHDIARFAELGVTANLQPLWAAHEPQIDTYATPFLGGDLAAWQYPFGDLHRSGAHLACGSDWPVSSPNPLDGIHVAVNRILLGFDEPAFLAHQRLDLRTALRAYTTGSAHVNGLDATGVLAPGNLADLVVLDRDPFAVEPGEIGSLRVEATYVGGVPVYSAS